jgi:hypothetical protein
MEESEGLVTGSCNTHRIFNLPALQKAGVMAGRPFNSSTLQPYFT